MSAQYAQTYRSVCWNMFDKHGDIYRGDDRKGKGREGGQGVIVLSVYAFAEWENTLGNVRIVFWVGLNFMGRQAGLLDYLHMRTGRDMWMMNESRGSWFILRSLTIAEITENIHRTQ